MIHLMPRDAGSWSRWGVTSNLVECTGLAESTGTLACILASKGTDAVGLEQSWTSLV